MPCNVHPTHLHVHGNNLHGTHTSAKTVHTANEKTSSHKDYLITNNVQTYQLCTMYKPLFYSVEEVIKCLKLRSFSPDAQAAHIDHVLWLGGTCEMEEMSFINHKDCKHFHAVVKRFLEYSPVALAYTTLARGSLFCSCSTALPILVDVAFLALWHSSKMICKHGAVKGIYSNHPEMYNSDPVFKSSH